MEKKIICLTFGLVFMLVFFTGCLERFQQNENTIEITAPISELRIEWQSGELEIKYHDESVIALSEEFEEEPDETKRMIYAIDGEMLTVCYGRDDVQWCMPHKKLTVKLPEKWQGKRVEITMTSGDVKTDDLSAEQIRITSQSGNICLDSNATKKVVLQTNSGGIDLNAKGQIEKLESQSKSGEQHLNFDKISNGEFISWSGNINLFLPKICGFTATVSQNSGKFETDFETIRKNEQIITGDGKSQLQFSSTSGDIYVKGK